MPYILPVLFPTVVILTFVYILYIKGYLTSRIMATLMYRGIFWKNRGWAKFSFCHGYSKKIIIPKESRNYTFTFNSFVAKGSVSAEIQDRSKNVLIILDVFNPEADIYLDENARYYLVISYNRASGGFEIEWN